MQTNTFFVGFFSLPLRLGMQNVNYLQLIKSYETVQRTTYLLLDHIRLVPLGQDGLLRQMHPAT